jgi:hypothetical protein
MIDKVVSTGMWARTLIFIFIHGIFDGHAVQSELHTFSSFSYAYFLMGMQCKVSSILSLHFHMHTFWWAWRAKWAAYFLFIFICPLFDGHAVQRELHTFSSFSYARMVCNGVDAASKRLTRWWRCGALLFGDCSSGSWGRHGNRDTGLVLGLLRVSIGEAFLESYPQCG